MVAVHATNGHQAGQAQLCAAKASLTPDTMLARACLCLLLQPCCSAASVPRRTVCAYSTVASALQNRPAMSASAAPAQATARTLSKKVLAESKFLRFVEAKYVRSDTDNSTVRSWQYIERTTTAADSAADAVAVFAVLKSKTKAPELVIVKQFRPPLDKYTIELCAGLIDPGDSPEEAALRELKEETGYTGCVVSTSGRGYVSGGLTSESLITVFVEIDADLPEHQHPPEQSEDDKTMIEVATLPLTGLTQQLQALEAEGYGIWLGLYSIAQGLDMRQTMGL